MDEEILTPEYGEQSPQGYHMTETDDYDYDDRDEDQFLGFSEKPPAEGIYTFFNKVLNLPRTIRVGNVDKTELGFLGISIRECLRVSQLGVTFGHSKFAAHYLSLANITTESSMAKKGWFPELIVTNKRSAERFVTSGFMSPPQPQMPSQSSGGKSSKWLKFVGGAK